MGGTEIILTSPILPRSNFNEMLFLQCGCHRKIDRNIGQIV